MNLKHSFTINECLCYISGMKRSKYVTLLEPLLAKPFFTAKEAKDRGIPTRMMAYFAQKGVVEPFGRGQYRVVDAVSGVDFELEELVLTACSIPRGVVCLISALCFYNLTDQIMREYWIAVPNKDKKPKRAHTRIVRMRNMTLGVTQVTLANFDLKIFDRERTVVDAFRYLSHEIAVKALQSYLKPSNNEKPNLAKLSEYAKALRVNITPYLTVLTT